MKELLNNGKMNELRQEVMTLGLTREWDIGTRLFREMVRDWSRGSRRDGCMDYVKVIGLRLVTGLAQAISI